jgi:hypothetical protein
LCPSRALLAGCLAEMMFLFSCATLPYPDNAERAALLQPLMPRYAFLLFTLPPGLIRRAYAIFR